MVKYLAVVFIFICSTIAWMILGTTIFSRTYSSASTLKERVVSIWGAPHVQKPPMASTTKVVLHKKEVIEKGKNVIRTVEDRIFTELPLEASRIDVNVDLVGELQCDGAEPGTPSRIYSQFRYACVA